MNSHLEGTNASDELFDNAKGGDSDTVLKYISQILMEEDIDENPSMFHDSLSLQNVEKPFYDAIGKNYPPSGHNFSVNELDGSSISEFIVQFQKGVEEASKFLPTTSSLVDKEGSRVRRVHDLDEDLEAGRISKQSAPSTVEEADDLSEIFDRVLLNPPKENEKGIVTCSDLQIQGLQPQDVGKSVVDLSNILILAAQATASNDHRNASELLKQIRQHSSPFGDGSQRMAHFFANALEACLVGTGSQIYTALASKRATATQTLKAYHLFVSFCPFKNISFMYFHLNVLKACEKRKKLHIIDFGILYGFHWPALIQRLSERPEGPPFLRITGIEHPHPGFKPAYRVEETGRRLAKYCDMFGVQFEFHPIAQQWATNKYEDLKLERGEVIVVHSHYRLKNLLEETIALDSPRDSVLRLIRKIKPDIFVHAVVNGSFDAPFFTTRFKGALSFYSALFDMYDTIVPRENAERSMFEREFYGREIMNVVGCEGTQRVERPETYKQWQVRTMRSGFKQLPLDPMVMEIARRRMKYYHKDYSLDVDGDWILMGWKGQVNYAMSTWTPC